MPLISVEPALHEHDGDPVEGSEEHPGDVTRDRGHREVRDLGVRERVAVFQQVSQTG